MICYMCEYYGGRMLIAFIVLTLLNQLFGHLSLNPDIR